MANNLISMEVTLPQPESMEAAREEFLSKMVADGYEVQDFIIHEQIALFDAKPDATVFATVRRSRNVKKHGNDAKRI